MMAKKKKAARRRPANHTSPKKGQVGRSKVKAVQDAPPVGRIDGVDPWDQLPGETARAFEAFAAYRSLKASERSLKNAASFLNKKVGAIQDWSSTFRWVERCRAWDAYRDRQARNAEIEAVREMRDRHVKISLTLQGAAMSEVNKLLEKARKTKNGSYTLTPEQMARFAELGIKLERLNRELPESTTGITFKSLPNDLSMLTDDEAHEFHRLLAKVAAGSQHK